MIVNPYEGSPMAVFWGMGFIQGLSQVDAAHAPPVVILPDGMGAYSEGLLAGQTGVAEGVEVTEPCIDAPESPEDVGHEWPVVIGAADVAEGLFHIFKHGITKGVGSVMLGLMELAVDFEHFAAPPEAVLPPIVEPFMALLASLDSPSMDFYCAAGIDAAAEGCQVRMSRLFRSLNQAKEAAVSMHRPQWVIACWRTDQCGGFSIVDES